MNDVGVELAKIETMEQFDSIKKKGVSVFLFTAAWSQVGKKVEEELETVFEKYEDKIKIGQIDVDSFQDIAIKHSITAFPTVLIFKDDALEEQVAGYISEANLSMKIDVILQ